MEPNTPYALYDDAARPQRWAAHVRLTPELLRLLQAAPVAATRVHLTLGGGRSKRPSVLRVANEENEEDLRYELLSFPEDARVTHVCALRRQCGDAAADGGYALEAAGRVHQKLLVQRLLDSAEKGRLKDRHAQSVRDWRARAAKLLDEQPVAGSKRRRVEVAEWAGGAKKAEAMAAGPPPPRKMVLRSSLSAEDAQQAREKIEKGFEPESAVPQEAVLATAPSESLFSSDSEAGGDDEVRKRALEAAEAESVTPKAGAVDAEQPRSSEITKAVGTPKQPRKQPPPAKQQPKKAPEAAAISAAEPQQHEDRAVVAGTTSTPQSQVREKSEEPLLPKVKKPLAAAETKRPLPRASRIPDLAIFPREVASICKRVSAFITRSAILDDADYTAFAQQYETLFADWETLDKAYSIEVIKTEGLYVRLRFARDEQERAALEQEREENAKRNEALVFVRDAMASIQKILSSLQASIARFDQRQEGMDVKSEH